MTKRSWIIFAGIVVVLLGVLVLASRSNQSVVDVSGVDVFATQKPNEKNGSIGDNVYGNPDSKVVIIEYGDYQCPGCSQVHTMLKPFLEEQKGNVKFIYRNYPIVNAHPNARAAAAAAEAAGLQGKYWEMHNKLYDNQSDWSYLNANSRTDKFVDYAKSLGLDTEKFKTDMTLDSINNKVNYDLAMAKKQGVSGTPTFFINGKQVDSKIVTDGVSFKKYIQDEIDKANPKANLPE